MDKILRILYFGRYFFIFAYIYVIYVGIIIVTEKYIRRTLNRKYNNLMSSILYFMFFIFIILDINGKYILALYIYPAILNIVVLFLSKPFSEYEKKEYSKNLFSESSKFIFGFFSMVAVINSMIQIIKWFVIVPKSIENIGIILTFSSFPFLIAFCIESVLLKKLFNEKIMFTVEHSMLISCIYFLFLMLFDVVDLYKSNIFIITVVFPIAGALTNIILAYIFNLGKHDNSKISKTLFLVFSNI